MEIFNLKQNDSGYPHVLKESFRERAPEIIMTLGNLSILKRKKLAFFCSVKCPGNLILKTHDFVKGIVKAIHKLPLQKEFTIVSGFHSPVEKECLRILLQGKQPVIHCLPCS